MELIHEIIEQVHEFYFPTKKEFLKTTENVLF